MTCLNFAGTESRILLPPLSSSRRVIPSRKIALNSNGEVNYRELARRPCSPHACQYADCFSFLLLAYRGCQPFPAVTILHTRRRAHHAILHVNAVIIATTNRAAILWVLWRYTDSLYFCSELKTVLAFQPFLMLGMWWCHIRSQSRICAHFQIPADRLRGSHITQYRCGYWKVTVPLRVLYGTLQLLHVQ